jgi:GNAT superfamily N-acetyltransferase
MNWRAMQTDDLAAVGAISDIVHGRYAEAVAVYAERLRLYPNGCRVLEEQGTVVGFLVGHPWHRHDPPSLGAMLGGIPEDADGYYLHDLALMPDARGSGEGAAASTVALQQARSEGLAEVFLIAVNGAERFWARQGFILVPDEGIAGKLDATYGPGVYYMRHAS